MKIGRVLRRKCWFSAGKPVVGQRSPSIADQLMWVIIYAALATAGLSAFNFLLLLLSTPLYLAELNVRQHNNGC